MTCVVDNTDQLKTTAGVHGHVIGGATGCCSKDLDTRFENWFVNLCCKSCAIAAPRLQNVAEQLNKITPRQLLEQHLQVPRQILPR